MKTYYIWLHQNGKRLPDDLDESVVKYQVWYDKRFVMISSSSIIWAVENPSEDWILLETLKGNIIGKANMNINLLLKDAGTEDCILFDSEREDYCTKYDARARSLFGRLRNHLK